MANFNLNKVILGGRLTSEPELQTTSSGITYTNFNMAVNRPKSKEGEQETDFIRVVAWRQKAELVSKYFHKGSSICVVGSIQTRSWTDAHAKKVYVTEVVADEINFVDSKSEAPSVQSAEKSANVPTSYTSEPITDDEELPF